MTPLEILSRQFRPFDLPTSKPADDVRMCGVYLLLPTFTAPRNASLREAASY